MMSTPDRKVRKTLRPKEEDLLKLDLKPGANDIRYKIESKIYGEQNLTAKIYLIDPNKPVVVSDIDGTITKYIYLFLRIFIMNRTDVMGQMMPLVGKDWVQKGVVKLLSNIKANGYTIIYLSSRTICYVYFVKNCLCLMCFKVLVNEGFPNGSRIRRTQNAFRTTHNLPK